MSNPHDLTRQQEFYLERERVERMRDIAAVNGAVYCTKHDELCYECKKDCTEEE